jgi:5-methylcytosine-specific restriction endonuclease McrA
MSLCKQCHWARLAEEKGKKFFGTRYEGPPWNKGKETGPNLKARGPRHVSPNVGQFQKGQPAHNKGKKMPEISGERHGLWKGGTTKLTHKIRTSLEYRQWREAVVTRDKKTCVLCGYVSCKPRDIRADHIQPFHQYPALRFEVSNGRTLCVPCDLKHGWQPWRAEKVS